MLAPAGLGASEHRVVPSLSTKPIIKRNANLKIYIKGLILNLKHKPRASATFYVSKAEL